MEKKNFFDKYIIMKLMKKLRNVFFLFFFLILMGNQLWAEVTTSILTHLKYDTFSENKFVYTVDFLVQSIKSADKEKIEIYTDIVGEKIKENNITYLEPDFKILDIVQTSQNQFDNAFFRWKIHNPNGKAFVYYEDLKTGRKYDYSTSFTKKAYTLQIFLYLIQTLDFTLNQSFDFFLIVPPAHTYHMTARIVGMESVNTILGEVECYKMELNIAGFFSLFFPKHLFWLRKKSPHIPVKYQDTRFVYKLSDYSLR
jgi:hypothetical protein